MGPRLRLKRRHLQFSIRTVLLTMVPCALLFGWLGVRMREARDRQARTDEQMKVIESITHLARHPSCSPSTGDVVTLWLQSPADGGQIGKELAVLKDLPALESLYLLRTRVADSALMHLQGLPALRELHFWEFTAVSDEGLVHVGKIRGLTHLSIWSTKITDAGLVHLKDMAELEYLGLNGTTVGDEGVRHLVELPSLSHLCLDGTQVTDDVLASLERMPALKRVSLSGSRVTKEGAAAIKKKLGGVNVYWDPPGKTRGQGGNGGNGGQAVNNE